MIAMIAEFAIVRPNVGPTDVESNERTPTRFCRADFTSVVRAGPSCLEDVWNTYVPSPLLVIRCTSGFAAPFEVITERTCAMVAGRWRLVVMRVPEVKSIP